MTTYYIPYEWWEEATKELTEATAENLKVSFDIQWYVKVDWTRKDTDSFAESIRGKYKDYKIWSVMTETEYKKVDEGQEDESSFLPDIKVRPVTHRSWAPKPTITIIVPYKVAMKWELADLLTSVTNLSSNIVKDLKEDWRVYVTGIWRSNFLIDEILTEEVIGSIKEAWWLVLWL